MGVYKGEGEVEVVVNMHKLRVVGQGETMLEVGLLELRYRVTTFSLFIESQYREYRFDGMQVLDIKNLIEVYRTYWGMLTDKE